MKTIGYVALDMNMKYDKLQCEVGKTCRNEKYFKFNPTFKDTFDGYGHHWYSHRVVQVEAAKLETSNGRFYTDKIKILKEITREDLDYETLKREYLEAEGPNEWGIRDRRSEHALFYYEYMLETDENQLVETYNKYPDPDGQVPYAMLTKLSDERTALDMFKDHPSKHIRFNLAKKLTQQDLMVEYLEELLDQCEKDWRLRSSGENDDPMKYLIHKIKDQDYILNRLKDYPGNSSVRVAVVSKISDVNLLIDTFKDSPDEYVVCALMRKMKDVNQIYELFGNHEEPKVRDTVLNRLTDQDLIRTYLNDEREYVRMSAENRLHKLDPTYVIQYLLTDDDLKISEQNEMSR